MEILLREILTDPCQESIIQLMVECGILPMDAWGKVIEFDQVFGDSLIVIHSKGFEVGFSSAYGVVGSKVVF